MCDCAETLCVVDISGSTPQKSPIRRLARSSDPPIHMDSTGPISPSSVVGLQSILGFDRYADLIGSDVRNDECSDRRVS